MPRSTRPVSRAEALKAAAEAVAILTDIRSRKPDPQLDKQIAAFIEAGIAIARTPDRNA